MLGNLAVCGLAVQRVQEEKNQVRFPRQRLSHKALTENISNDGCRNHECSRRIAACVVVRSSRSNCVREFFLCKFLHSTCSCAYPALRIGKDRKARLHRWLKATPQHRAGRLLQHNGSFLHIPVWCHKYRRRKKQKRKSARCKQKTALAQKQA